MTHAEEVLALLRTSPVTPLQAWSVLGDYRLADTILKLRKRGHLIETRMKDFVTTRGKQVRFAEYVLVKEAA